MKEFFISDCVQYENKIITSSFRGGFQAGQAQEDR